MTAEANCWCGLRCYEGRGCRAPAEPTADLTPRELSDLRFAIRADRVAAVRGLEWPTARVERVVAGIKAAAVGAGACCGGCCGAERAKKALGDVRDDEKRREGRR